MTISIQDFNKNIKNKLAADVAKQLIDNEQVVMINVELIVSAMQIWFCDQNRIKWSEHTKKDMRRLLQGVFKKTGILYKNVE